jgi:5-methylcytosine-specific restriction protein A
MPYKALTLRGLGSIGWIHPDKRRPDSNRRGYGYQWRKVRNAYLAAHPYCEAPSCNEVGVAVDHKIPRKRGGTDDESNLQSLCRHHHASKTAKYDERWGKRV